MNIENGAYVYILKCRDAAYYTGIYRGLDLAVRIAEHNSGHYPKAWTHKRRPVELMWSEHFGRVTDAIAYETQIKRWSRAKKEALIVGNFKKLRDLSKSRSAPADPTKKSQFQNRLDET
jgi:putative endonuclease